MRAGSLVSVSSLTLSLLGCQGAGKDSGAFDCLQLGGGYEGEDLDRIEEICVEGGGTNCEPEDFIESDAARCVAAGGRWDESMSTSLDASLAFSAYFRLVAWNISDPDGISGCVSGVNATTGEFLGRSCP